MFKTTKETKTDIKETISIRIKTVKTIKVKFFNHQPINHQFTKYHHIRLLRLKSKVFRKQFETTSSKRVGDEDVQNQGQNLQNQMANVTSLLTSLCNNFKNSASTSNSGTLPSQTVTNPRQQINAITTRKQLNRTSALADSGASINLLPHSIYKKLGLEALTPTRMTLELANRSITHPMGIAEDVVVRVDGFTFLADFVVVNFELDPRVPIILGRPFLRTAKALIDLYEETLTLRDNPFSGSTTNTLPPSSSPVKTSDNLEKFADELARSLIHYQPDRNQQNSLKPLVLFDLSFSLSFLILWVGEESIDLMLLADCFDLNDPFSTK
ncbi:reverse transcriptase domain-containing protein [Tanacetum coccineum]